MLKTRIKVKTHNGITTYEPQYSHSSHPDWFFTFPWFHDETNDKSLEAAKQIIDDFLSLNVEYIDYPAHENNS